MRLGRRRAVGGVAAADPEFAADSPDTGGVFDGGKVLRLGGRYCSEVCENSTDDGHLLACGKAGAGPHGLCVRPRPGRYVLGRTGVFRRPADLPRRVTARGCRR
nr:hypothetical protein KPHV_63070 [Kitasatospora purpeofusca]